MYSRIVEHRVREALSDTPAVMIVGPRRAGKTTLVKRVSGPERRYVTLDDPTTMDLIRGDPVAFIRGLENAAIDEVQRAPELLLAIKKSIDEDYRPGRFLLTGSANVMTLPKVADSLAGRMETINMLPLSQSEVINSQSTFLNQVFRGEINSVKNPVVGDELTELVLQGGFPEAIARPNERRRNDWLRSYLTSILTRDLADITEIEKITDIPVFVQLLAQHSAQLINYSELGTAIGTTYKTSQRYISLLEKVFVISRLQPWYTNAIKRIIKTPKVHFLDTGLLAMSNGLTLERIKSNRSYFGALLETFVFTEIKKLISGSEQHFNTYHFRDHSMREVDIVLERDDGKIVGIEVKANASVKSSDFAGLKVLEEVCKDRFAYGIVLYDSSDVIPFGNNMAAVPVSSLWG